MEPVTAPVPADHALWNHDQRRAARLGRAIPGFARFAARDAARAAALALIRQRRAELAALQREILAGWAEEALIALGPREQPLIATLGNCQLVPITIREGAANGTGDAFDNSWNLPVVETLAE